MERRTAEKMKQGLLDYGGKNNDYGYLTRLLIDFGNIMHAFTEKSKSLNTYQLKDINKQIIILAKRNAAQ